MDITQTSAVSAPSSAAQSITGALKAEADFDTFLKLLTAQLENQDPLQPMESTEFVAQLAQFSAVEQQIRSNLTLEAIAEALNGGSGLADWLGKDVLAPTAARFDGAPVELRFQAEAGATAATLVVSTLEGSEVARLPLEPGVSDHVWNGELPGGGTASTGVYAFRVEQVAGGEPLPDTTPSVYSRVTEARAEGGARILVLDNGVAEIDASDVTSLRLGAPSA